LAQGVLPRVRAGAPAPLAPRANCVRRRATLEMRAWGDGPGEANLPQQREDTEGQDGRRRSRSREWSRGRSPKGDTTSWGGSGWGGRKGGGKGRKRGGGKGGGFRDEPPSAGELDGELNRYFGIEAPSAPAPMGSKAEKAGEEKEKAEGKAEEKAAEKEPAAKDEAPSAEEQKLRDRARRFGLPGAAAAPEAEKAKPEAQEEAGGEAAAKEAPAEGAPAGEPDAKAGKE